MTTTPPGDQQSQIPVPASCLDLTGLEEITGRELAARRAWLLDAISAAEPATDDTVLAALTLAAVITQLSARAEVHAAHRDESYECACGFRCTGLAAIDDHLDTYDDGHYEQDAALPSREAGAA